MTEEEILQKIADIQLDIESLKTKLAELDSLDALALCLALSKMKN